MFNMRRVKIIAVVEITAVFNSLDNIRDKLQLKLIKKAVYQEGALEVLRIISVCIHGPGAWKTNLRVNGGYS